MSNAATRIMIVEDDDALRHILALRFSNGGYDVTAAASASEALAVSSGSYDLVVTDVHLPGISGIELARTLHDCAPQVPVVFVSGDGDAHVIREALETKSSAAYMIKPFQLCELDEVVALVLKHARAFTGLSVRQAEPFAFAAPAPFEGAGTPEADSTPRFRNRIAHLFDSDEGFSGPLLLLALLALTAFTAGILRT